MGRLTRKKAPGKTKKKKFDLVNSSSLDANVSARENKAVSVGSENETKKRTSVLKKKASGDKKSAALKPVGSYFNRGIQFLREVKVELLKVTWPTRKQTIGSTVVVIILSVIIAFFLGVVDVGLSGIIRTVLG